MKKIAIVTGAASGIGRHIAQELAQRGVKVLGIDKEKVSLENVDYYKCDVSNEQEIINCIYTIEKKYCKIDYLINAAGILCYKKRDYIEYLTLEEWRRVFEVNLESVFLLTKYSIPLLRKSKKATIINFSTEQVNKIKKKSAPYVITKAAIEMLTKVIALELLDEHIRVNAIALASVNTDFIRKYINDDDEFKGLIEKSNLLMPYGIISVKDVWKLVEYLIDEDNKMTGQILVIDSGVNLL